MRLRDFSHITTPLLFLSACALDEGPAADVEHRSRELMVCAQQAEECISETPADFCGPRAEAAEQACVSAYEDCSYGLKGAHDDSAPCLAGLAWCWLECKPSWPEDEIAYCEKLFASCG